MLFIGTTNGKNRHKRIENPDYIHQRSKWQIGDNMSDLNAAYSTSTLPVDWLILVVNGSKKTFFLLPTFSQLSHVPKLLIQINLRGIIWYDFTL